MSPRSKTPLVQMLPVRDLKPSELNPRLEVGDVSELADSIASLGVLVPLLVSPHGKGYLVIAGHRRLAAAKSIKLAEVPAIVRDATELERLKLMVVENQQRVPLTPVEEGIAYARIIKQHGVTQRQLAKDVGVSEFHVSTRLSVLNLDKEIVQQIHRGEIPVTVALGYAEDTKGRITAGQRRAPVPHAPFVRASQCEVATHEGHAPDKCEIQRLSKPRKAAAR